MNEIKGMSLKYRTFKIETMIAHKKRSKCIKENFPDKDIFAISGTSGTECAQSNYYSIF